MSLWKTLRAVFVSNKCACLGEGHRLTQFALCLCSIEMVSSCLEPVGQRNFVFIFWGSSVHSRWYLRGWLVRPLKHKVCKGSPFYHLPGPQWLIRSFFLFLAMIDDCKQLFFPLWILGPVLRTTLVRLRDHVRC